MHDKLACAVKDWKVQEGVMDALIQNNLTCTLQHPSHILDLVSDRLGCKASRRWKQATKQGDVDHVLDASQVKEAKGSKGGVSLPVDLFFLLDDLLYEKVGKASLCA
jgi:hypothetical protein